MTLLYISARDILCCCDNKSRGGRRCVRGKFERKNLLRFRDAFFGLHDLLFPGEPRKYCLGPRALIKAEIR